MAYTGKKPGDVSLSTLYESGGALQNHDDVTVDASGNVGIGTTSPAEKLEIYNGAFKLTGSNGAGVRMTHGNTENGGEINLLDTNGAVKGLIDYVDADDDGEGTMRFLNLSSTTGEMEIGTNGANVRFRVGGSEKLRILPTGGITFNGDTAAANALDDYEEGSWTPVGNGVTLTVSNATYTKIGNLVSIELDVTVPTNSDTTNDCTISGLPYSADGFASASLAYTNDTDGFNSTYLIYNGDTYIDTRDSGGIIKKNNVMSGVRVILSGVYETF